MVQEAASAEVMPVVLAVVEEEALAEEAPRETGDERFKG